jgi:hypothetical protein
MARSTRIDSIANDAMEEFFFIKIPLNIMITPKIADVIIAFIAYWFFI